MSLSAFRRLGFAAWLVALALIANLAAQNQLALNVVEATTEQAAAPADPHAGHDHHAHHAAAAPVSAAPAEARHNHHAPGGHTHKGHADCAVCGVVATMAALTLPATVFVHVPSSFARPADIVAADVIRPAARYALYISRAPPILA